MLVRGGPRLSHVLLKIMNNLPYLCVVQLFDRHRQSIRIRRRDKSCECTRDFQRRAVFTISEKNVFIKTISCIHDRLIYSWRCFNTIIVILTALSMTIANTSFVNKISKDIYFAVSMQYTPVYPSIPQYTVECHFCLPRTLRGSAIEERIQVDPRLRQSILLHLP